MNPTDQEHNPASSETSASPTPPPAYYPPAPAAAPKSSVGWKITIGIAVLLLIALMSCCGLSFWAIAAADTSSVSTFGDTIAVIHLDGVIAGTGTDVNGIVSPEDFNYKLDQAADDPNVKAVLLRVDSPGGTVAASQEISMDVARFEKPIVVSSADVNASGAYMVSSQCDEIYALPTSAVGSIGVISQIPNLQGLLEKLGIEFTTVTAGENKDTGSMYRSLTTSETAMIQHEVDIAYEEFIRMVAEGRDMPEEDVRELATGWAWSGIEAQEMGLVDELGTYDDALARAAELGGIEGSYETVSYDEYAFEDLIYSLIGITDSLDRLSALDPEAALGPVVPR